VPEIAMNINVTSQTADGASGVAHPLDPLDAVEIAKASSIIRQHYSWGDDLRVETIDIAEPDKATVRGHAPGGAFARIAR
jgi:primary-amine oxidase